MHRRSVVNPGGVGFSVCQYRDHHPLVHVVPAWTEVFQLVDGWQVALRVGEGHQLSMDQIPVPGRTSEAWCADLLLPAGVGQRVGGVPGQDQSFRHLEGREPVKRKLI